MKQKCQNILAVNTSFLAISYGFMLKKQGAIFMHMYDYKPNICFILKRYLYWQKAALQI